LEGEVDNEIGKIIWFLEERAEEGRSHHSRREDEEIEWEKVDYRKGNAEAWIRVSRREGQEDVKVDNVMNFDVHPRRATRKDERLLQI
jgi:hypothetical protein